MASPCKALCVCPPRKSASFQSLRLLEGVIDEENHSRTEKSSADDVFLWLAPFLMIFAGCAAQLPHEIMNTRDKGCGDLISLFEYVFGFCLSLPWCFSKRPFRVEPRRHAVVALLALSYVFFSNVALSSKIPTSIYVVLKNGTLLANLVVGTIVLRKRYSLAQYAAVALVTLGLASTALRAKTNDHDDHRQRGNKDDDYLLGIVCLVVALLSRAGGSALQERYMHLAKGDVSTAEMIFMRTAMGLPFFLARSNNVRSHLQKWLSDPAFSSSQWLLLFTNLLFDYLCKIIITTIIQRRGALHASLVLSFQKFLAFTVSVVFVNPTLRNSKAVWAGSLAVLIGTLAYSAASTCPLVHPTTTKKDKQKKST